MCTPTLASSEFSLSFIAVIRLQLRQSRKQKIVIYIHRRFMSVFKKIKIKILATLEHKVALT